MKIKWLWREVGAELKKHDQWTDKDVRFHMEFWGVSIGPWFVGLCRSVDHKEGR